MDSYLIDSHCHLNFPDFQGKVTEVIAYAKAQGVRYMQTICTELAEFSALYEMASIYPELYCSVGIHPCHLKDHPPFTTEDLIAKGKLPKVIGFGETGLDYYYDKSNKSAQITAFVKHIEAAAELDLPLIIHTRDAEEDTAKILADYAPKRALIHCFTGSAGFAEKMLELGCYISISGVVTFKNAVNLQEIVRNLPLERMLIETDSPYLAPTPHRGKGNQPGYVRLVAEFIANLKALPLEVVAKTTSENFFHLFSKAEQKQSC